MDEKSIKNRYFCDVVARSIYWSILNRFFTDFGDLPGAKIIKKPFVFQCFLVFRHLRKMNEFYTQNGIHFRGFGLPKRPPDRKKVAPKTHSESDRFQYRIFIDFGWIWGAFGPPFSEALGGKKKIFGGFWRAPLRIPSRSRFLMDLGSIFELFWMVFD